jgi:pimeloyl-ACP methyl ester carboxylesterase
VTTFVLIPGAWHGAWSWIPVAHHLRAAGHHALALTMPGLNDGDDPAGVRLRDAVDHVTDQVRRRDLTDVVLVAHSWGGYPMTGAAHALAGRLSGLVYYNANVPARGRSMLDELPPARAAAWRELLDAYPGSAAAPAPLAFVREKLMQDQSPQAQHLLWRLLMPQPRGYWQDALDLPELDIPSGYILSTDDVLFAGSGPVFAARLGADPVPVPGSHESLLTHPAELAEAIAGVRFRPDPRSDRISG